jgi:Kef-type K+ transport system membrane component KefB
VDVLLRAGGAPRARRVGTRTDPGPHDRTPRPGTLLGVLSPLLSLAAVVAGAYAGGLLAAALRQPRVVGEIAAGLALGPVLVGDGDAEAFVDAVAQLGLVLFMLLVGMEVDLRAVRRHRRLVAGVSAGAVAVPFALGTALGFALRPDDAPFALFVGLALAVTAMPVLARILDDTGLAGTPLGTIALACAAVNDVAVWLGLAAVGAVVGDGSVWGALAGVLGVGAGLLVLRPFLGSLPVLLAVTLAAAALTDALGLHVVIGAFLAGLAAPRDADVPARIGPVTSTVLLPAFFFTAGLGLELGSVGLGLLAATLALATVGKVAGAALPARALGLDGADALRLGVLMNTRGLTLLVLLEAGRELGLLGPELYAVLVVCALVTTAAAGPLLRILDGRGSAARGLQRTV